MSKVKDHYIDHYFIKNGGYFVSWNGKGLPTPRGLYLKKFKNTLKISEFSTTQKDREFQNIETYFQHRPLPIKKVSPTQSFSLKDPSYQLAFDVSKERPWIFLFKKENKMWVPKVALRDDMKEKLRFDDSDPSPGKILVKFKKVHFTQGINHEILVINSNFPMGPFPTRIFPHGNLVIK